MDQKMNIFLMKVLFAGGIAFGSRSLDLNYKHIWIYSIARFVLYVLTVQAMNGACVLTYLVLYKKRVVDAQLLQKVDWRQIMMFFALVVFLLFNEQSLIDKSFFFILTATVILKYPTIEKASKVPVNYAVGLACSYFEGYLVHIMPSDGSQFFGFMNSIRVYEDRQGVRFPVRKLFIIATKSLYSPPAIEDLNSDRADVARLEACSSLTEVEKDVAGIKNRIYRNFAYKIYRPDLPPVYLALVGGTPMHTLYRVLKNNELGAELAGMNREEIVADFFNYLRKLIARSPECRDKCELIYFDDTDRNQNLADVLLDRIRELEPNFEQIISSTT